MRTIAIAAPKGGSGKTTTTLLLAVHAAQLKMRVAMFDMNADQPSISNWLASRSAQGDLFMPNLIEVEDLAQDVKALAFAHKHDLLLIDTPPVIDDTAIVEGAVAVSDAVIVPCRPSALDIGVMDAMVEICREHRKPFSFLLCDVTDNWKGVNNAALAALTEMGPVMAARITHKVSYVNAITIGKTGPEIDSKLQPEIAALWSEAVRLAGIEAPQEAGPPPKKGRRRG